MKLLWELFGPKEKLNTWITIAVWVGILSLFAFTAVYKVICYDEIENDYSNLYNVAMVIELPEGSYDVKYERSSKLLYSMQYIQFMSDVSQENVIATVRNSLLSKGFKEIDKKTNLAAFLKEKYYVYLYLGKNSKKYYINIYQDNWKGRLGI